MDRPRDTSFGSPEPGIEDAPPWPEGDNSYPTPSEVFGRIGRILAVCLVLAVLAQILVAYTGIY